MSDKDASALSRRGERPPHATPPHSPAFPSAVCPCRQCAHARAFPEPRATFSPFTPFPPLLPFTTQLIFSLRLKMSHCVIYALTEESPQVLQVNKCIHEYVTKKGPGPGEPPRAQKRGLFQKWRRYGCLVCTLTAALEGGEGHGSLMVCTSPYAGSQKLLQIRCHLKLGLSTNLHAAGSTIIWFN